MSRLVSFILFMSSVFYEMFVFRPKFLYMSRSRLISGTYRVFSSQIRTFDFLRFLFLSASPYFSAFFLDFILLFHFYFSIVGHIEKNMSKNEHSSFLTPIIYFLKLLTYSLASIPFAIILPPKKRNPGFFLLQPYLTDIPLFQRLQSDLHSE